MLMVTTHIGGYIMDTCKITYTTTDGKLESSFECSTKEAFEHIRQIPNYWRVKQLIIEYNRK